MSAATATRSADTVIRSAGLTGTALKNAVRTGMARGRAELRHTFTNAPDLAGYLVPPLLFTAVMLFMRGHKAPGTAFSLGSLGLPSLLGAGIGFSGLMTMAQLLTVEREDGTLLRAKATPNGMAGYLIGKIVQVSGMTVIGLAIQMAAGAFLFQGLALDSAGTWLGLTGLLALGLVATLPLGAIIGSMFSNPRNIGFVMVPVMGLVATSGIFYPITHFPVWLQWIAQVFPLYWLGLGMRSVLLPGALAHAEIGGSWRHLETVGILGAWAVAGLLLAPIVLRRMARRESGSRMAMYREKLLKRIG